MPIPRLANRKERASVARRLASGWTLLRRGDPDRHKDLFAGIWYLAAEVLAVWAGIAVLGLLLRLGIVPWRPWVDAVLSVVALLLVPMLVLRRLRRE